MAGIDLASLLQNVAVYQAGTTEASNQIAGLKLDQAVISSQIADMYKVSGTDSSTVEAAKQADLLRTQAKNQIAANAFGTDITQFTNNITEAARVSQDAYNEKLDALRTIQQKQSVGLLDNPIEYLMNQFTVNSDIARHNTAESVQQAADSRIMQLNAETQAQVQTNNALSTPVTVASAAAAARNAATVANINAKKTDSEALSYNIEAIASVQNAKKEVLQSQYNALNAIQTQQQIALSQKNLEIAIENNERNRTLFQQGQLDYEDKNLYAADFLEKVNKGRLARGFPELDATTGRTLVAAVKSRSPLADEYMSDYSRGSIQAPAGTAGVNIVSTSPASIVNDAKKGVQFNLPEAQKPLQQLALKVANEIEAAMAHPGTQYAGDQELTAISAGKLVGLDPKAKQDYINSLINTRAQEKLNAMAANVDYRDGTNLFNPGDLAKATANNPNITSLPVYQKVIAPLATKGVDLSNPMVLINAANKAVAAGEITFNESLDLQAVFRAAHSNVMATRNFQGLGYVPSYKYMVSMPTSFGAFGVVSDTPVDVTKSDQYVRAIMQMQAIEKTRQATQGNMPIAGAVR